MQISDILDTYGRKARLFPAFLTLAPAFLVAFVYLGIGDLRPEHAVWAVISAAAIFFVTDLARRAGRRVEKDFLNDWGGYPSKLLLRHSDGAIDKYTKSRYHRKAETLLGEIEMPTATWEEDNSEDADCRYESVVRYLLSQTRDTNRFSLLFKENIHYGFRRNLYGLKAYALALAIASAGFVMWMSREELLAGAMPEQTETLLLGGIVLDVLLWSMFVTKQSVRDSADDYGRQLLSSLDVL